MLRGVYPECNEWVQGDSAVTHMESWITVFNCIIGPYGCPVYFVKRHYRAHISTYIMRGREHRAALDFNIGEHEPSSRVSVPYQ